MTGTDPSRRSPSLPDLVACPVCGPARARLWIRQPPWQVVRCRGCGLLLTWPRPTPAEIEALYANPAYYDERDMGGGTVGADWEQRAAAILSRLPRPVGRALDFGAGQGHLTHALRGRGISAEGYEPSPAGRRAARGLYALALWDSLPEATDPAFDLVTLIHVLEHAPDPLAVLRRLHALLGPGGIAYIEVPHAGGLGMWRPQLRRLILDLPFHLCHFLPRTLMAVVERAGFEVLELGLANPAFLERLLSRRARRLAARTEGSWPAEPPSGGPRPALGIRRLWAGAVLPTLRRLLPGDHFHLLAVKRV